MNLSSHISHGSKAILAVVEDFMLFTECDENDGERSCKEFVNGADKGYGYVVCDNCEGCPFYGGVW